MEIAGTSSPKFSQHSPRSQQFSQITSDGADVRASSTFNPNLQQGPNVFSKFDVIDMDGTW